MRRFLLWCLCAGCASSPSTRRSPAADPTPLQNAILALRAAAELHAKDDPAVARTATEKERAQLLEAADELLKEQHVPHVIKDGTLVVEPHASALGAQVQRARDLGNTACVYDPFFFVTHPYAAASHDGPANVLYLSMHSLLDVQQWDASVEHELTHVKTWADLRARKPSPHYGFLRGPPYQPNDLRLDEMVAYRSDLHHAAVALRAVTSAKSVQAEARLVDILRAREADGRPDFELSPTEKVFDAVVAKVIFGQWHTLPALEGLTEALSTLLNGQAPTFSLEAGVPLACVHSARPTPEGSVTVTACVPLVLSHGADDPENVTLMRAQLESALDATRAHAALQQSVLEKLHAALLIVDGHLRWQAVRRVVGEL